ncbi:MAG TPA: GGDEF domain-containing protein [Burkholderiales bacterium]|nr:GGDEF domain-containing protein [Burkholderiales bacterium]
MIEAPLLPNEVQRLKALHDLGVLYAPAEERFDRITRPYDAIGRYGGEEFLLVLGDCSEGTARQIAERVRLNVASESVAIAGKSVSVTVSMGITTWSAGMPASAEELIRVADEALSRAKISGRNRFVIAQI